MTEPQGWQPVDPSNPPATRMVAIYNDGSGAQCLSDPLFCRVAGVHRFTVHPRAVVALSTTSKEVG